MDPVTHTFTGAALAAGGLRRITPLASATLIVAANAPDIDVLAYSAGPYAALAFRRGWTHGPLALLVLPCLVAAAMLAWDRWIRRRRHPAAAPARAAPLAGLAALGVATHPVLDWLNNYGVRWLMPFDGRWFYGDALFIIDPWIWLVLGGALFLVHAQRRVSVFAWTVLAAAATYLVLPAPIVAWPAKSLWVAGLIGLAVWRMRTAPDARGSVAAERLVRRAGVAVAIYVVMMIAASAVGRALVRAALEADGHQVEAVMVAPSPANPFAGMVVAVTPGAYHHGSVRWLRPERLELSPDPIARRSLDAPARAAMQAPEVRHYLTWARFPFVETEAAGDGYLVHVRDARYLGTTGAASLRGVTVRLDAGLRPVHGGS